MNRFFPRCVLSLGVLAASGPPGIAADDRAVEQRLKTLEEAIDDLESTISDLEETLSDLIDQFGQGPHLQARPPGLQTWGKLEKGMSLQEVRKLLGEPRSTSVSTYQIRWQPARPGQAKPATPAANVDLTEVNWHYDDDPAGARVVFDAAGRVLRWHERPAMDEDC